jgi:hypothetical protein
VQIFLQKKFAPKINAKFNCFICSKRKQFFETNVGQKKIFMSLINTDKGIITFGIYKEIFPIVIETYQYLEKNNNLLNKYPIYIDTINNLFNILSNLSKGYNKFHSRDKMILYSYSRDCVSTVQSNLLILSEIEKTISKAIILDFYNKFEEKIKYFNGLIKKMEEKQKI